MGGFLSYILNWTFIVSEVLLSNIFLVHHSRRMVSE